MIGLPEPPARLSKSILLGHRQHKRASTAANNFYVTIFVAVVQLCVLWGIAHRRNAAWCKCCTTQQPPSTHLRRPKLLRKPADTYTEHMLITKVLLCAAKLRTVLSGCLRTARMQYPRRLRHSLRVPGSQKLSSNQCSLKTKYIAHHARQSSAGATQPGSV